MKLSHSVAGISVVLELDESVISVILDRDVPDAAVGAEQLVEIACASAM